MKENDDRLELFENNFTKTFYTKKQKENREGVDLYLSSIKHFT